jgi:hypothetical protein
MRINLHGVCAANDPGVGVGGGGRFEFMADQGKYGCGAVPGKNNSIGKLNKTSDSSVFSALK